MEIGGYVKAFSISSSKQHQLFVSDDLVMEILARVGQRTLMRCRSVCKDWERLISDQGFINRVITRLKTLPPLVTGFYYGQERLNHSSYQGFSDVKFCNYTHFNEKSVDPNLSSLQKKLTVCKNWKEMISDTVPSSKLDDYHPKMSDAKFLDFLNDTDLNEKSVDTSLSFLQRKSPMVVVSSHDGFLLCAEVPGMPVKNSFVYDYCHQYHYIICNPLTKQWVELPQPPHSHHIKLVHLFCYNNKNRSTGLQTEFKVVSLKPISSRRNTHVLDVNTYTSNTGIWKSSMVLAPEFLSTHTKHVLFDGSVYFKTLRNLYAYDLKEENIRCTELPDQSHCGYNDLLGVSASSIYYAEANGTSFRVWILDDGIGWSLQHHIDYSSLHNQLSRFGLFSDLNIVPLAIHPINHNVILMEIRNIGLHLTILYHKDSRRVQVIDLNRHMSTNVIPYSLPSWIPSLNTGRVKGVVPTDAGLKSIYTG